MPYAVSPFPITYAILNTFVCIIAAGKFWQIGVQDFRHLRIPFSALQTLLLLRLIAALHMNLPDIQQSLIALAFILAAWCMIRSPALQVIGSGDPVFLAVLMIWVEFREFYGILLYSSLMPILLRRLFEKNDGRIPFATIPALITSSLILSKIPLLIEPLRIILLQP